METDERKKMAASLFNRAWDLMEKTDRSRDEDFLMIHTAHASLYHWLQAGTPLNEARGQWQVSRVYAILGWAQPALAHAERSLGICLERGYGDFDLAFGYEAVARAHALAGNGMEAEKFLRRGHEAAEAVKDARDRDHVLRELGTIR